MTTPPRSSKTHRRPAGNPAADSSGGRYHVPNLSRALMILEHLSAEQRPRGVSEIADALDIPKNSVFRILTTLHAYGYLLRNDDTKQYVIGPKLLSLAHAGFHTGHLVEQAMDAMRWVRDQTDETTLVGVIDSAEGVILEQVLSNQQVKVVLSVGTRFPLHTAAPAKAYLAHLPADQRDAIVDEITFTRFTDATVTDRAAFEAELDEAKRVGYALDVGEHNDGIRCVGSAVLNQRAMPIGCIWVVAPAFRADLDHLHRIGPIVRTGAARISERFGHLPAPLPQAEG